VSTPNKSPLRVAFNLPLEPSRKRKAELIEEDSGYCYVRYSGESEEVVLSAKAETDLLTLVRPFETETDPFAKKFRQAYGGGGQGWNFPELDRKKVLKFLNTWGTIGFRNEANFNKFNPQLTDSGIVWALGYHYTGEEATSFLGKNFPERYQQILKLNEIPFPWIEEELQRLAFCVRLTNNLFRDQGNSDHFKREKVFLTQANLARIVSSSSHFASLDFKDDQDPATRKINMANLDHAEEVLNEFADEINRYLRPLTISVMQTNKVESFYTRNLGFETALACAIVMRFRVGGTLLICQECKNPYFPKRLTENAKYCGDSCGHRVRDRNYKRRTRAKVSATKAGKKETKKVVKSDK
jgi:hypothetical protein